MDQKYNMPVYELDGMKHFRVAIEPQECGRINGLGTILTPLRIELTPMYAAAPELLRVLEIAEVHLGWGDCSLENVHAMCREAIANAKSTS